jgi:phosphomannomutase
MSVPKESVFKAYDIRGIYPSELDEEAAYLIGRAFATIYKDKSVVVGGDARISTPYLKN